MKKKKRRYGVYNLVEWHANMRLGKGRVKVVFSGGAVTASGITPATFTTDDPLIQMAIEESQEFKSGKIKLLRSIDLKEEIHVGKNPHKPSDEKGECVSSLTGAENADAEQVGAECGTTLADVEPTEDSDEPRPESDEGQEQEMVAVEFELSDDARDYLEREFGCVRSKLRTRADIVEAGKSRGVKIVFV